MVWCIGETVLDIIFRDDGHPGSCPGGSMLNTAVSLGRADTPVSFISIMGDDPAGSRIISFLQQNGVDTRWCRQEKSFRTPIALAFLDPQKKASYTFYRPDKPLFTVHQKPCFMRGDIILYGSYFAISPATSQKVAALVDSGLSSGALTIYDPNFRRSHLDELAFLRPALMKNFECASVIRGSDEDFLTIFGTRDPEEVYSIVCPAGDRLMIMTQGASGAEVRLGSFSEQIPVSRIKPVSTIGAGDAFNAGLIFRYARFIQEQGPFSGFYPAMIRELVSTGIRFSSEVCLRTENYVSKEFILRNQL